MSKHSIIIIKGDTGAEDHVFVAPHTSGAHHVGPPGSPQIYWESGEEINPGMHVDHDALKAGECQCPIDDQGSFPHDPRRDGGRVTFGNQPQHPDADRVLAAIVLIAGALVVLAVLVLFG